MRSKVWFWVLFIFLFQAHVSWAAETKPDAKPEAKTEAKQQTKQEAKPEAKTEAKPQEAKQEPKLRTVYKSPKQGRVQIVGFDANGNPAYLGESYSPRSASLDELKASLLYTVGNVSRAVCDLSIRPATVTTLVGSVNLTWETDKICKAAKSEKSK